jgi:hypothetical protein
MIRIFLKWSLFAKSNKVKFQQQTTNEVIRNTLKKKNRIYFIPLENKTFDDINFLILSFRKNKYSNLSLKHEEVKYIVYE